MLEREIASAAARSARSGSSPTRSRAPSDPRLIELDRDVPWKEVVVTAAPDALFVVYPKRQGWGLEAVPRVLGSFENRRDLPPRGPASRTRSSLALTGVEDALFCHAKRFLVGRALARGERALAALALADVGAAA